MTLLLVWLILALGAAIQAAIGFGLGLIAAPILLLIEPDLIPGPLIAAATLQTGLSAYRDRTHIDFTGLRSALAGRFLGTFLAALFLLVATAEIFDLAFAATVLIAVFASAAGIHVKPRRWSSAIAGTVSGMMGTISSVGGPPMALLYQRAGAEKLRATLSAYALLGAGISIAALAAVGRFGQEEVVLSLLLTPPMLIGFLLSNSLLKIISERAIRPLVLVFSFFAACVVMFRVLW